MSLYELLLRNEFPPVRLPGTDIAFAPGALDATMGGAPAAPDAWKTVQEIIEHPPADWSAAETRLRGLGVLRSIDTLFQTLDPDLVTPAIKRLFWEIAFHSSDYEAVKWGVAIGCIRMDDREFRDAMTFARHPEFTLYCSVAFLREGRSEALLELLPEVRQWAVIRVIEAIVRDEDLISRHDVQREVIRCGMERSEGIPMEIAYTIASHVDLSAHFDGSDAIVELLTVLLTNPESHGRFQDLPNADNLRDDFVSMLATRPPDVAVLRGLQAADTPEARHLALEMDVDEVVRRGLADEKQRWPALAMIREKKLTSLLPDVRALVPQAGAVWLLSEIGGPEDVALLLETLPRIVDLEARAKRPKSDRNVLGPDFQSSQTYAQIVGALGRLATPVAGAAVKRAARDFDPVVRAAAVHAMKSLPQDPEISALLRELSSDPSPHVSDAARKISGD